MNDHEQQISLNKLDDLTTKNLASVLIKRSYSGLFYTYLNSNILVSTDPHNDSFGDFEQQQQSLTDYASITYRGELTTDLLQPHIYELAVKAYYHLRRLGQDQCIILKYNDCLDYSGNFSNFNTCSKITNQIFHLSKNPKKQEQIYQSYNHLSDILKTFCANKNINIGFNKELQFNSRGRLVGFQFDLIHVNYSLLNNDEICQSFCIFNQVLNHGKNEGVDTSFVPSSVSQNNSPSKINNSKPNLNSLKPTIEGLKYIGLKSNTRLNIFNLIYSLILLNNTELRDLQLEHSDSNTLEFICSCLGIDRATLINLLFGDSSEVHLENNLGFYGNIEKAFLRKRKLIEFLYSRLLNWIISIFNNKTKNIELHDLNTLSILNLPSSNNNQIQNEYESLHSFAINESIYNFIQNHFCSKELGSLKEISDDGSIHILEKRFKRDNLSIQFLYRNKYLLPSFELCKIMGSDQTNEQKLLKTVSDHIENPDNKEKYFVSNLNQAQFSIKHYSNTNDNPTYNIKNLMNDSPNNPDSLFFIENLKSSANKFILELIFVFSETETNRNNAISQTSLIRRSNSIKFIETTISKAKDCQVWVVYNLLSSSLQDLEIQIRKQELAQLTKNTKHYYGVSFEHREFLERYETLLSETNENNNVESTNKNIKDFLYNYMNKEDFLIGNKKIFINFEKWKLIEDQLKSRLKQLKTELQRVSFPRINDTDSFYSDGDNTNIYKIKPLQSNTSNNVHIPNRSESNEFDSPQPIYKNNNEKTESSILENKEKISLKKEPTTLQRKVWLFVTWALTWWIPSFVLSLFKMKTYDVQIAWREKVALCLLIFISWVIILFVNIFLGIILCPKKTTFTPTELSKTGVDPLSVYMYGKIYNITQLYTNKRHEQFSSQIEELSGKDVSFWFPKDVKSLCTGFDVAENFEMRYPENGDLFPYPHNKEKNIAFKRDNPNWSQKDMKERLKELNRAAKNGIVVYDLKELRKLKQNNKQVFMIEEKVYDLTPYFEELKMFNRENRSFLPDKLEKEAEDPPLNFDLTNTVNKLKNKKDVMNCLNRVFYAGQRDQRKDTKCLLTDYMLIAFSGVAIFVTLIKFLSALQLTGSRDPLECEKFVIFQVPCYTESKESIRRTVDSLAVLEYNDHQKLLFVIADGIVTGSGNEQSTPQMILDVFNIRENVEEAGETFAYKSIASGGKQLNTAKVYSGLYEVEGRSVPFIIVIKCGNDKEQTKRGNRGKRDSQIVLMNFLSKVHYDDKMSPLEIEMYNHLQNKIGVSPKLYEYVLMVDADTMVEPDSLTRLVSVMIRDSRIIGLCGETQIYQQNKSIVTMGQVYEYYISHNLAKSFESLFGSVTCLPGCFCMYRIKSIDNSPLIIHRNIINSYSENIVDTLHKKNLLHLGEDRYLTTLIIKNFPEYKTKFINDAICKTVVPEKFSILLSQRRRWINSTIHNFFELVLLRDMCGCLCFSMRFIVILDLIGTLLLPASVIYLIYIIIAAATQYQSISKISILMMSSIYILQSLIFIIKRKWEHIGWMVIYMLGMMFFNFYIPVYSFWHFDDFSWGNTRMITEDGKKKVVENDENDVFIPSSVPLIKWSQFESKIKNHDSRSISPNNACSINKTTIIHNNFSNYHITEMSVNDFNNPENLLNTTYSEIPNAYVSRNTRSYMPATSLVPFNNRQSTFSNNNGFNISEEILVSETIKILAQSDLTKITKRNLKNLICEKFNIVLTPHMERIVTDTVENYIHSTKLNQ